MVMPDKTRQVAFQLWRTGAATEIIQFFERRSDFSVLKTHEDRAHTSHDRFSFLAMSAVSIPRSSSLYFGDEVEDAELDVPPVAQGNRVQSAVSIACQCYDTPPYVGMKRRKGPLPSLP